MKSIRLKSSTILPIVLCTFLITSCSSSDSGNNPTQIFPSTTDSQSDSGNWDPGTTWDDESCNDSDDIDCDGTSNRFDFDIDGDGIPDHLDDHIG